MRVALYTLMWLRTTVLAMQREVGGGRRVLAAPGGRADPHRQGDSFAYGHIAQTAGAVSAGTPAPDDEPRPAGFGYHPTMNPVSCYAAIIHDVMVNL